MFTKKVGSDEAIAICIGMMVYSYRVLELKWAKRLDRNLLIYSLCCFEKVKICAVRRKNRMRIDMNSYTLQI